MDVVVRGALIYAMLPTVPRKMRTREIIYGLKKRGFVVSRRTTERDLAKMMKKGIICRSGKPRDYIWSRPR